MQCLNCIFCVINGGFNPINRFFSSIKHLEKWGYFEIVKNFCKSIEINQLRYNFNELNFEC